MTNANDARRAHELIDAIGDGHILSSLDVDFLRSFLPELPKQMTLEEIYKYVGDAWLEADDPESKEWLHELHAQLKGLKDKPVAVPALPAGMRLADHEGFGRAVVSPGVDDDGTCKIFYLSAHAGDGSDYCWVPIDSLTFADGGTFRLSPPEFLETEADYQNAPEGTIVACEDSPPWHKFDSTWLSTAAYEVNNAKGMTGIIRRVLRWGDGE